MRFREVVGCAGAGILFTFAAATAHADYSPYVEHAISLGFPRDCAYRIAYRESRYDPEALGPWFYNRETGRWERAHGLFQIIDSTWEKTPQGRAGMSYNDGYANAEAAYYLYTVSGLWPWKGC